MCQMTSTHGAVAGVSVRLVPLGLSVPIVSVPVLDPVASSVPFTNFHHSSS